MMLYIAFTLFLLIDSIGNIPYFIHLLKGIPPHRQRYLILREMLIALAAIICFNFIGDLFLGFLHITRATVQIAGGVILFLISIKMIFPSTKDNSSLELQNIGEPLIVPLAIPLIAGPAVLAAVMLYSHEEPNYIMLPAIFIAWSASLAVLIFSPLLSKMLGKKGILALEKLMGLIMVLISVQMFLEGIKTFFQLK
jgi:multiple antibiotic resistance protein